LFSIRVVWCCVLLFGMLPSKVLGWNVKGHTLAVLAIDQQLEISQQHQYRQLADTLYTLNGSPSVASKRNLPCLVAQSLCYFALWPETVRDKTLRQLYAKSALEIPSSLHLIADIPTRFWHYHNVFYDIATGNQLSGCLWANEGKLVTVLPELVMRFEQANAVPEKAMLLSFIVHLITDIHQPLHAFSGSNVECQHDRGGNGVCVTRGGRAKHCALNLHQLWDRGAGAWEDFAYRAQAPSDNKVQPFDMRIEQWVVESVGLAKGIYEFDETERYRLFVQSQASEKLAKAIDRTLQYLNQSLN